MTETPTTGEVPEETKEGLTETKTAVARVIAPAGQTRHPVFVLVGEGSAATMYISSSDVESHLLPTGSAFFDAYYANEEPSVYVIYNTDTRTPLQKANGELHAYADYDTMADVMDTQIPEEIEITSKLYFPLELKSVVGLPEVVALQRLRPDLDLRPFVSATIPS